MLIGAHAATELVQTTEADVVLNGITGAVGLRPTIAALEAGNTLALANKESLIIGGRWSPRGRRRARSSRSTPSTAPWPSDCAAGEARRCVAWWSPPAGDRSGAAPVRSCTT
jgi:hypothetical protein